MKFFVTLFGLMIAVSAYAQERFHESWTDPLWICNDDPIYWNSFGPVSHLPVIPPVRGATTIITEENFICGLDSVANMQKFFSWSINCMRNDWNDVKGQLQNFYIQNPDDYTGTNPDPFASAVEYILENDLPAYSGSTHTLIWEYHLPGTGQITTSFPITINATNN